VTPDQLNKFITIVFVTIDRNQAAKRFVRSVRRRYPKIPILAADQNGPTDAMTQFYRDHGVRALWLPYDCGLSFARNRAFEQIQTRYVMLADDDFIFTDVTELCSPIEVMELDRRIGFLGGRLIDIRGPRNGPKKRFVRRWEKHLFLDRRLNSLISVPIDYMPLESEKIAGHEVFRCDMTLNWGVMRRAVFSEKIRWDENIKINGEHEDFFLGLKTNSCWKVCYLPELLCDHEQPDVSGYHALRGRLDGRERLADKWGLTHHLELGVGLRNYENYLAFESVPLPLSQLNVVSHEPKTPLAPSPVSKKDPSKAEADQPSRDVFSDEQFSQMRRENAALHLALAQHKRRELALRQSWSWRLTKPLRVVAEKILRSFKAE